MHGAGRTSLGGGRVDQPNAARYLPGCSAASAMQGMASRRNTKAFADARAIVVGGIDCSTTTIHNVESGAKKGRYCPRCPSYNMLMKTIPLY